MRRNNGFTIAETIVALALSVLVLGAVLAIYLMSMRSWREGSAEVGLERNTGIVVEKIVRGPYGRFGVREADVGTVQVSETSTSVTYMVDKQDPPTPWNSDDFTSRYYQDGTDIIYDPDTSISGDELPLNRFGDVQELNFSLSGQVLTVKLILTATVPGHAGRTLTAAVHTEVFFRKRK